MRTLGRLAQNQTFPFCVASCEYCGLRLDEWRRGSLGSSRCEVSCQLVCSSQNNVVWLMWTLIAIMPGFAKKRQCWTILYAPCYEWHHLALSWICCYSSHQRTVSFVDKRPGWLSLIPCSFHLFPLPLRTCGVPSDSTCQPLLSNLGAKLAEN